MSEKARRSMRTNVDINTARGLSIAVSVLLVLLTAIQSADPATLGLSTRAVAWLGLIGTALGACAVFLPSPKAWWAE